MLLKKIGLAFFVLFALNANSQQLVRATDVKMVSAAGTFVVIQGGISFQGTTTNWLNNGETHLYKNTAPSTEGWLDSTSSGVMDLASTGHVFFRGTNRQSFYGKTRFWDLTINNTIGDTLLTSCEVRHNLHLDTGFIFTRTGYGNDSLLVSNTSPAAITSTSFFTKSWVNGRLSRTGNEIGTPLANFYLFPVGKTDSLYAPIKLAKLDATTATWTAEYTYATPYNNTIIANPPIDHISHVEYWEITSNNQLSADDDATLSLSWRTQSYVSSNPALRDGLIVAQYIYYPPFQWNIPGGWQTGNTSGSSSFGYVTSNATTNSYSFDERRFTLGTINQYNPLPIKLIYFTALADGNRVRLNWEAANEQETVRYEIEKSLNGRSFSFLSTVSSRQLSQSAYSHFDYSPVKGWNYYRLKVIDKSGHFFYSELRAVKFDKDIEQVKIFPVPATTVLNVQLPSSYVNQTTLQVITVDGKVISSLKPAANMVIMHVQALAAGTYFLQIIKTDGHKETLRFIKH